MNHLLQATLVNTNINILRNSIGLHINEIDSLLPIDTARTNHILHGRGGKGNTGQWFEWALIGSKGDTISAADIGTIEIKSVTVNNHIKPNGNISITSANYYTDTAIDFENSHLCSKLNMLVGCFDRTQHLVDIRHLDLTKYHDEVRIMYEWYQQSLLQGKHLNFSGSWKKSTNGFIVLKPAGTSSSVQVYVDEENNTHTAKKRNFGFFAGKFFEMSESIV